MGNPYDSYEGYRESALKMQGHHGIRVKRNEDARYVVII